MSLTLVRDFNIDVSMSPGQTNWPFVINVSNSIIGVTVLAMPFCFKTCGILLGCLMLMFSTWLTVKSCQLLMKAGVTSRRRSYSLLAYYTHGATGKLVVELGMIGLQLGTLVAQVVIIGDLGPAIVSKFTGIPNTERLRTGLIVVLCLFVGLPLGLLKDVRNLSKTSAMCIIFYAFFTIYVVLLSVPKLLTGDWYSKVNFWRQEGFFQCLPIFSFAFGCQTQLFIVYDALSEPSLKRINSIVGSAVHMCTAAYLLVGFFGYIAFSDVADLSGDIINHFGENTVSDAIKLFFVFSIAVSIPLIVFPCRASLYTLLFPQKPQSDMPGSWKIPEFHFKVITTFIVVGSMIIGILVPNIEFVLGLNGATMGTLICYIFPALFFLAVMSDTSEGKSTGRLVLILGMTIMIVSTYTTLSTVKIEEPQAIKPEPMDKDLEKLPIKDDPIIDLEKKDVDKTEVKKDTEDKKPPDKTVNEDDDERQEPPNPQPPDESVKRDTIAEEKNEDLGIVKKEKSKEETNVADAKEDVKAVAGESKEKKDTIKEADKEDTDKKKDGEEEGEKMKAEIEEKARKEEEEKWKEKDRKQEEILEKLEQQKEEQQKILEEQKHILEELKQHQGVHKDEDGKSANADQKVQLPVQQQEIAQPDPNAQQAAPLGAQPAGGQQVLAQQPVLQQVDLGLARNQQQVGQQINAAQAGNQQLLGQVNMDQAGNQAKLVQQQPVQQQQQPVQQQQQLLVNQDQVQGQGLNLGKAFAQQGIPQQGQLNQLGGIQQQQQGVNPGVAGQQAVLPAQGNQPQMAVNNAVNLNQQGLVGQQQGINLQQGVNLHQGVNLQQGAQQQVIPNQQLENNLANNVINQVMGNEPLGAKPAQVALADDKVVDKDSEKLQKLKEDPNFRMKRDVGNGDNQAGLDNIGDNMETEGGNRDLKQVNVQDNDEYVKNMLKPVDNELGDINDKLFKDLGVKNVANHDILSDARKR